MSVAPIARAAHDVVEWVSERPGHGTELARNAADQGFERVIAVGGDGTLNEIANGLIGTRSALAVIPAGTGNDFARTHGIPKDPLHALSLAIDGPIEAIDVGLAVGHRHFVNMAGAGFDGRVTDHVKGQPSWLHGLGARPSYLLATLAALRSYRARDVEIVVNGVSHQVPAMFLTAIGLGRYFGGGMHILPQALPFDSAFDVVWAEDLGVMELARLFSRVYRGRHLGHPKVHTVKGARVAINGPADVKFQLDGDTTGVLPVVFEAVPGALRVVRGNSGPSGTWPG